MSLSALELIDRRANANRDEDLRQAADRLLSQPRLFDVKKAGLDMKVLAQQIVGAVFGAFLEVRDSRDPRISQEDLQWIHKRINLFVAAAIWYDTRAEVDRFHDILIGSMRAPSPRLETIPVKKLPDPVPHQVDFTSAWAFSRDLARRCFDVGAFDPYRKRNTRLVLKGISTPNRAFILSALVDYTYLRLVYFAAGHPYPDLDPAEFHGT